MIARQVLCGVAEHSITRAQGALTTQTSD